MPGSRPCRRTHHPGATGAFTLVELVTAASLMTVMMLGVVQIFAIVTKTAGDAEGLQYATEQGRSFFDTLHRDVQGLTREGYLRIVKGYVQQNSSYTFTTTQPGSATSWYGTDTLAMTSVGLWSGVWSPNDWNTTRAPAAEVIYTRYVLTDAALLTVGSAPLDNRCGILGRGQWLLVPKSDGARGSAGDMDDYAKVTTLCSLFNQPGAADPLTNRYTNNYVKVWPVTAAKGTSDQPQSLQRVMACRVSEFYVEYLLYDTATGDYVWNGKDPRDCRSGNNVGCPRAIRVTITIHDPDDRKALPSGDQRFRGYAMQEVFWIGDP